MKKRDIYIITADFLEGFNPLPYYVSAQSSIRGREEYKKEMPLTPEEIEEMRVSVAKRNYEISQEVKKNQIIFNKYPKLRDIVAKLAVEYLNKAEGNKNLAGALLLATHPDDNNIIDIEDTTEHLT